MAGTTNDEDLLILSDDNDFGSEFVLDEQIIIDDKDNSSESELITFDSELTGFDISSNPESNEVSSLKVSQEDENDFMLSFDQNEVKEEVSIDSENNSQNSNFDFSIGEESSNTNLESTIDLENSNKVDLEKGDIFGLDESKLVDNITDIKVESISPENNNMLLSEDTTTTSEIGSVGTMTDILDEAIAKFAKREELIASDISLKENHIKELKNQISALESAVNTDNEEVTRLNTEKQSILKNRKALEKMKETPAITK